MTPVQIREYLEYYRDLGFDSVYMLMPPTSLPSLAPPNDTLDQIRLDI
jgi:hypothetical protein